MSFWKIDVSICVPFRVNQFIPKAVCTLYRFNIALYAKYRPPRAYIIFALLVIDCEFLCLVNVEDISFAPLSIINAAVIVLSIGVHRAVSRPQLFVFSR